MSDSANLSAGQYQQRISHLIERGRLHHATQELALALAEFPDDSDLLYEAARIDVEHKHFEKAKDTLLQLLTRDPEHLSGRFLLVAVYEALKELVKSEAVLLDLLREHPQNSTLYAHYSLLMYRTLHVKKADALAREALRLDPNNEQALAACLMGDLIKGNTGAQKVRLSELLRKYPEDQWTSRLLIVHLTEQGKYWSAKRIAIELLRAQPDSAEILNLVVELETLTHWTMIPLWPFNRWGVGATIGFFLLTLFGLTQLNKFIGREWTGTINTTLISYCVYSWVYPSLLKRWLQGRAGI
jgi:tetratricopeptide (TPR) repeat protein